MKRPLTPLISFCLVLLSGCSGTVINNRPFPAPMYTHPDTGTVSNPNQSLVSFIIKAADNPNFLTADVSGSITFDTIRLVFPLGTDLSNLIPTIVISGGSISPASQVPENVDSAIVYTVTATDGSKLIYHAVAFYQ
jgi:hypothetical protein